MKHHFDHLILFSLLVTSSKAFLSSSGGPRPCRRDHDHAATATADGRLAEFELKASRRAFLLENIVSLAVAASTSAVVATATTLLPQIANAEEGGQAGGGGGDIFKEAQERMAARSAARSAARKAKEEQKSNANAKKSSGAVMDTIATQEDSNEFVFKAKVQEIQEEIAERKERAILLDQQETKRFEENEFILELKARSAANKEKYQKESMQSDKLSSRKFSAQYKRPSYTGVQRNDGSIWMVPADELEVLEKSNRIQVDYEIGVTRDGKEYTDYSKKILKLVGEDPVPTTPPSSPASATSSEESEIGEMGEKLVE